MVDRLSERIGSSKRVTTKCLVDKQEKTSRHACNDDGKTRLVFDDLNHD